MKNGIDHEYVEKDLEVFSGDGKTELEPDNSNRVLSVEVVEFFDYVTIQKKICFDLLSIQRAKRIWNKI